MLVENDEVGGLAKVGLDYASLAAAYPRLACSSITGFGQTGPCADRAGYDFVVRGPSGFVCVTGEADGEPGAGPQTAGIAITDLMTGMYATVAIQAALAHRDRIGEGQHTREMLRERLAMDEAGIARLVAARVVGVRD